MGNDGRFRRKHPLPEPGTRYGELTVVRCYNEKGYTRVECRCSCGAVTTPIFSNLRKGATTRCNPCAKKKAGGTQAIYADICPDRRHRRRLLGRMYAAITRCTDPTSLQYPIYGGRGIAVCGAWLADKRVWLAYLLTLPGWDDPKATLDRIDNDRGYEPGNLRFVSHRKQQNNKRQTVWVEYGGKRMSATEFHREHAPNFAYAATIINALRRGETPEQIVERSRGRSIRRYRRRTPE